MVTPILAPLDAATASDNERRGSTSRLGRLFTSPRNSAARNSSADTSSSAAPLLVADMLSPLQLDIAAVQPGDYEAPLTARVRPTEAEAAPALPKKPPQLKEYAPPTNPVASVQPTAAVHPAASADATVTVAPSSKFTVGKLVHGSGMSSCRRSHLRNCRIGMQKYDLRALRFVV